MREKLNLKYIASRDVTMKVFDNEMLQEILDLVDAKLKCTEKKYILIHCFVKVLCQPFTGQDISHAKGKFWHLNNLS